MTLDDIVLDFILREGPLTKEEIVRMYREKIQSGAEEVDGAPTITIDSILSTLLSNGNIEWKYGAKGFSSHSPAASGASDDVLTTRLAALDRAIQAVQPLRSMAADTPESRCIAIVKVAERFEQFLLGVEASEDSVARSRQSNGGMISTVEQRFVDDKTNPKTVKE